MRDRITSKTITDITYANAKNPPPPDAPVPAPEDIIANIIENLENISNGVVKDPNMPAEKAAHALKKLKALLNDLPEGLELATVAYSRISGEIKREAWDEFGKRVKPKFFRFLAETRADDLKAMGICDYGIDRMRNGLAPADDKGNLYGVSVDHIIERAGAGHFGLNSAVDPDVEDFIEGGGTSETFLINHFRNLILLPNSVHFGCKNLINDLQGLCSLYETDAFQWSVMLVPKDGPEAPAHLYVPTDRQKHKYGLSFKNHRPTDTLDHASYIMYQLEETVRKFNSSDFAKAMTSMQYEMANSLDMTVEALLRKQHRGKANNNLSSSGVMLLKHHFHQTLYGYGPQDSRAHYEQMLKLAYEARRNLRIAFNQAVEVKKKTGKTYALEHMQDFLQSSKFKHRHNKLSRIPEIKMGSVGRILGNPHTYEREISALLSDKPQSKPPVPKPQTPPSHKKHHFSDKAKRASKSAAKPSRRRKPKKHNPHP